MRKLVEYPTPSLNERDRRWAALRKEMDARGLDCLILCGWPTMWGFNIANARYLCPIGGNAEVNVLVFPRAGGLAGPLDPDGWVPHRMYARLQARLPKARLVNLDDMMEKL